MKFDYIVADPTGNITVLVTSPYTADNRQEIIRRAFELVPDCEQVGFVMRESQESGRIRLEMMGYEFCGNATLSTAAWLALCDGLPVGERSVLTVDSSGQDEPLQVTIRRLGTIPAVPGCAMTADPQINGSSADAPVFEGTFAVPVPDMTSITAEVNGSVREYPVVEMSGISHMIVPAADYTDELAESVIRGYAERLGVPALGMILFTPDEDAPDTGVCSVSIRPLVYVKDSDTLIWEHGCATGSTAMGWYQYLTANSLEDKAVHSDHFITDVRQPGGTIRITIADGSLSLTGRVIFRKI